MQSKSQRLNALQRIPESTTPSAAIRNQKQTLQAAEQKKTQEKVLLTSTEMLNLLYLIN